MTDAQTPLAQIREALSAGPTPGEWSLRTVPTSDGSCHKIGPFPSASRIHSETHACVYAIGIRLGINDSTPVARELLANARLMAACSPANIAAILAHVEAQAAEIERLRTRLEIDPRHPIDGVEARDATIREQDKEIERLRAALRWEQHRAERQDTHGDGCADWGPAHYECAIRERDELRDVLLRGGFVLCDIPACNCGSWHHRYGLPERMQDIKDALAEAGHELSNANGNLTLNALKALVAERDELRRQLDPMGEYTSADELIAALRAEKAEDEAMKLDARRYRWLLDNAVSYPDREHVLELIVPPRLAGAWRDDIDAAIDAAMGLTRPAEES